MIKISCSECRFPLWNWEQNSYVRNLWSRFSFSNMAFKIAMIMRLNSSFHKCQMRRKAEDSTNTSNRSSSAFFYIDTTCFFVDKTARLFLYASVRCFVSIYYLPCLSCVLAPSPLFYQFKQLFRMRWNQLNTKISMHINNKSIFLAPLNQNYSPHQFSFFFVEFSNVKCVTICKL